MTNEPGDEVMTPPTLGNANTLPHDAHTNTATMTIKKYIHKLRFSELEQSVQESASLTIRLVQAALNKIRPSTRTHI